MIMRYSHLNRKRKDAIYALDGSADLSDTLPMEDVEWIKRGLEKPGKTQRGLASAMGVDPSAVSKMINGKRGIKSTELPKIERYIGESHPGAGSAPLTPQPRQLPILGAARGGIEGVVQIDPSDPAPTGWVDCPPALMGVKDAYALSIDGDSMATTGLSHGAKAFVNPHKRPRAGNLVVLVKTNSEAIVKRLVRESDGHYVLAQTDPPQEFKVAKKDVREVHLIVGAWFER